MSSLQARENSLHAVPVTPLDKARILPFRDTGTQHSMHEAHPRPRTAFV